MATVTAFLVPDYANTTSVANTTGSITTPVSGVSAAITLTFGKRRLLHIAALNIGATANRCAISYTLGLSTGTTAPAPTTTSPFFMGDEGFTIDLGDLYDQIAIASDQAKNGQTGSPNVAYSVSVMSKF